MPATGLPRAATEAQPEPSLPSTFTKIRDILDERLSPGRMVNVMGLVKDCRLPVPTRGTDFKCTLTLFDLSEEDEEGGLVFCIFRPEDDMPQVSAADIVVLTRAKVQKYRDDPVSLITHSSTSIRVYAASKIPRPPASAKVALAPAPQRDNYAPSDAEHRYVSQLYHKINKAFVPDEDVFKHRAERSLNVKNKFSLLKDVQEKRFYDLIAQVATEPYIGVEMATLYVSDYTENENFHHHLWEGLSELCTAGGDPWGYTSGDPGRDKKEWVGPSGKMSIQITCFQPHASAIGEKVSAGQWVALRNVAIKRGRDGKYLEGFLHGSRNSASTRIGVQVLEANDRDTIDPNLKEAIRRWRDYTKKKTKQIKDIKAAHAAGQKRKASQSVEQEGRPLNSRNRRALKRAAKEREKKNAISEELRLRLNDQVTCETHSAPYSTVESILEPTMYETTVRGQKTALVMPFTCAKYQARVRVVDFFPPSLKDFACSWRPTQWEVLSDNEDDSDAPSSSSVSGEDSSADNRVWEWRFAIQLEDPGPPAAAASTATNNKKKPDPRRRLWVLVDNPEAELLTGLDAADLRREPGTLAELRERMFTLWGDLEEHKARAAKRRRERRRADPGEKGKGRHPRPGEKPPLPLQKPPLESSDEEDEDESGADEEPVMNTPFTCCIRQYGVYDKEAGKWVQCFGLFGTKICR